MCDNTTITKCNAVTIPMCNITITMWGNVTVRKCICVTFLCVTMLLLQCVQM